MPDTLLLRWTTESQYWATAGHDQNILMKSSIGWLQHQQLGEEEGIILWTRYGVKQTLYALTKQLSLSLSETKCLKGRSQISDQSSPSKFRMSLNHLPQRDSKSVRVFMHRILHFDHGYAFNLLFGQTMCASDVQLILKICQHSTASVNYDKLLSPSLNITYKGKVRQDFSVN